MPIYVVKKYVEAKDIKQAIKKETTTPVHECWLHEDSSKHFINKSIEKDNQVGFR